MLTITQQLDTKTTTKRTAKFSIRGLVFPYQSRNDYFKALDGLRGLAVLLVILSHASLDKVFPFPGADLSGTGKPGVFLFFVLSAYLLDRQIIVGFVSCRANKRFWINYFLRRFMRIFPLYIIALFVFYGCSKIGFATPIHDLPTVWKHITLQEGLGIFWSIVVEFKYYFISPLIMAFCNYVLDWNIIGVTVFILNLIGFSVYLQAKYKFDEITLLRYLPIFLLGTLMSIYEVLLQKKADLKMFKSKAFEYAGLFCALLIILSVPSIYSKLFLSNGQKYPLYDSIYYVPYAVAWSVILLAAKYGSKNYLKKFFELTFLRFLGVISFSTYLFHLLVLKAVENKKLHIPDYAQCYIFLFFTCIICLISYLLTERNLQRVRVKY
jgi:peptidoglycan/LPS O-acetylase OafA/YrhL